MPMQAACKIRALAATAVILSSAGCATHMPARTPAAPGTQAPARAVSQGRAYQISSSESLLIVRVHRGGTLARAGHNHILATHELTGTVHVADDIQLSSFELKFPVASLTVDEAELRAAQGADFAADVPDTAAKEGTRHNMLGPALLDAEHYPEITLRCESIAPTPDALLARVAVTIRAQVHIVPVPISFTLSAGELLAQAEFTLKQSDLGLVPFSALMGALQVKDEMQLQVHLVARAL